MYKFKHIKPGPSSLPLLALIVALLGASTPHAAAQVAGDYRSFTSGDWNNLLTWQTFDGTAWLPALTTPTSSDGVITILTGNTVTVTADVTVDQVVVSAGGQLTVNSGVTLTVADQTTGTELDVFGTLQVDGIGVVSGGAGTVCQINSVPVV